MSKALVLSGGGPVGIAWETGIAAGLAAKGVDLGIADYILGTSAGSAVGAQIALGRDLGAVIERYRAKARQLSGGGAGTAAVAGTRAVMPGNPGPMQGLLHMMAATVSEGRTPEQAMVAIGRYALDAETIAEAAFLNSFRHLRGEGWPARFACTAVDAETGELVVWNAENSTDLERAVASSCAVPGVFPPITINGRRYIDGGLRSGTSADLAAGHELVLIVTLRDPEASSDSNPQLERAQRLLANERKVIEDAGGKVVTVVPNINATAVMGGNPHDSSVAPAAAAAGFRQGEAEADRLRAHWT